MATAFLSLTSGRNTILCPLICAVGEKVAREEGIEFFYQDFREGWQEGVDISLALELYRQPYCGCIFSEKERYWKPPKNTQK